MIADKKIMSEKTQIANSDSFLAAQENKSFLRILTCGSVDDGKSTLIGRLLHDTKLIFEDQLLSLRKASKTYGTTGDDIDLALLVDGLEAEREQGITIDVAYLFFATQTRKYIIADTPGHVQYTRNMVTGASTADLAILMVDARKGLLEQTKRHAFIVHMLGIEHVILAINKMDLVDFSEDIYNEIKSDFADFAGSLDFKTIESIPISARYGNNVISKSEDIPWYSGACLLDYLDQVEVNKEQCDKPFRMAVQWVNRPDLEFRGFCGTVSSGAIKKGAAVSILPSGSKAMIKDIIVANSNINAAQDISEAVAGDAVTIVLDKEIDISRGDLFCSPKSQPIVSDQFCANIIWMSEEPLYAGRPYLIKMNAKTVAANITAIKHKIDINTFNEISAKSIELNEIAVCNIATNEPLIFDSYKDDRSIGRFIIIDRMSNATIGAGMINYSLYRANNLSFEKLDIDKSAHSKIKGQKPVILWFTGLSGSGKSTIANLVEQKLYALGRHTYVLDGDNVRHGLNRDLGFTDADRVENIRRIGEVAKLMLDAGVITLVSFISPFISERKQARSIVEDDEFIEIFIDTPLKVCQQRDAKGLYKKAEAGEILNFTGISSPYEPPENPELSLDTVNKTAEELADNVIKYLKDRSVF